MDEDDIYYIDTRNAEPIVVSRSGGGQPVVSGGRVVSTRTGGRVVRPTPSGMYNNRYPTSDGNPYMVGSTAQPYGMAMGMGLGGLFANTTPGQLIDLVAQVFAAVMTLPTPPTPTSDPATDVPNLITYQTAITQYEKRDEQIRTLGNIVQKLLG
jgi:hypothetical protein